MAGAAERGDAGRHRQHRARMRRVHLAAGADGHPPGAGSAERRPGGGRRAAGDLRARARAARGFLACHKTLQCKEIRGKDKFPLHCIAPVLRSAELYQHALSDGDPAGGEQRRSPNGAPEAALTAEQPGGIPPGCTPPARGRIPLRQGGAAAARLYAGSKSGAVRRRLGVHRRDAVHGRDVQRLHRRGDGCRAAAWRDRKQHPPRGAAAGDHDRGRERLRRAAEQIQPQHELGLQPVEVDPRGVRQHAVPGDHGM